MLVSDIDELKELISNRIRIFAQANVGDQQNVISGFDILEMLDVTKTVIFDSLTTEKVSRLTDDILICGYKCYQKDKKYFYFWKMVFQETEETLKLLFTREIKIGNNIKSSFHPMSVKFARFIVHPMIESYKIFGPKSTLKILDDFFEWTKVSFINTRVYTPQDNILVAMCVIKDTLCPPTERIKRERYKIISNIVEKIS